MFFVNGGWHKKYLKCRRANAFVFDDVDQLDMEQVIVGGNASKPNVILKSVEKYRAHNVKTQTGEHLQIFTQD